MAIRVLKSVPSAQSVVKKLFASFEQLFAVLYLFSGAHHPFGGRVQINFRIINGNSCSKIRSICSIRGQKYIRVIRAIRVQNIRSIRVQKAFSVQIKTAAGIPNRR